jgi:hypothetical protein
MTRTPDGDQMKNMFGFDIKENKIKHNGVRFSSLSIFWNTPKYLYEELNKEFDFDFDPCPENPKFNGLSVEWGTRNFVNPPYGKFLPAWIKKGYFESLKGKLVVFLIPSRTDVKWWHEYVMKANEIRFIRGRLKYGDAKHSAPFPSCVVIFRGNK